VAAQGTTRTENRVRPTQGAFHETLEVTQGWTSWLETGFYLFTSIEPDEGWEWVGNHVRPRVRAPESWELPVGLSLSLEVGYQRREFSADTWTLELRPIIDKKLGGWYASFNPVFARSLKGEGVNEERGFEFTPNAKVAYDVTSKISAGLEYYGELGPVGGVRSTAPAAASPLRGRRRRSRTSVGVQRGRGPRPDPRDRRAHLQGDPRLPLRLGLGRPDALRGALRYMPPPLPPPPPPQSNVSTCTR
jgi:hypothetical protein